MIIIIKFLSFFFFQLELLNARLVDYEMIGKSIYVLVAQPLLPRLFRILTASKWCHWSLVIIYEFWNSNCYYYIALFKTVFQVLFGRRGSWFWFVCFNFIYKYNFQHWAEVQSADLIWPRNMHLWKTYSHCYIQPQEEYNDK